MESGPLVAGIDSSTQSTKVIIADSRNGQVVAEGRAPHIVGGADGARETDPEVWWSALRAALAATGLADRVSALSIAGQQHGLVCLGADGAPLRPAMLWNDTRSADEAATLVEARGAQWWADAVGSAPVAAFTLSKWVWVRRHEPAVAAATRALRLPHDFLTERVTGEAVTDRGDASGTAWFDAVTNAYRSDVLAMDDVALDVEALPRVLGPAEAAGVVTAQAAAWLGVRPGIPVGCGTGDNMAAALGLGLAEGQAVVSLGTSGTAYTRSSRSTHDASGTIAGFADATGQFLPLACTLNCTLAVDRFADWLGIDREDVEPAGDVVVLPFLDGERTPNLPHASGLVVGLRQSTTRQQILQAAYDGAALALLDALDVMRDAGANVDRERPLILVGGGARGKAWKNTFASLSGREIALATSDELVAIGAAIQAAACLEGVEPTALAPRFGVVGDSVHGAGEPDRRRTDVMRRRSGQAGQLLM